MSGSYIYIFFHRNNPPKKKPPKKSSTPVMMDRRFQPLKADTEVNMQLRNPLSQHKCSLCTQYGTTDLHTFTCCSINCFKHTQVSNLIQNNPVSKIPRAINICIGNFRKLILGFPIIWITLLIWHTLRWIIPFPKHTGYWCLHNSLHQQFQIIFSLKILSKM